MTRNKWLACAGLCAAAIGAAAWQDTAAYRTALASVDRAGFDRLQVPLNADMARARQCGDLQAKLQHASAVRDCYIAAMREAQSDIGAYVLTRFAVSWLAEHPDDTAVREAALASVAAGRTYLLAIKPQYDAADRVDAGQDASMVISALYGRSKAWGRFERSAHNLDQTEYAVRLPGVTEQQRTWRRHAVLG